MGFFNKYSHTMKLKNLREYQLGDVVKFNQELNPVLWEKNETLRPEVRDTLLQIAEDFQEFLGVNGYELDDITISGSNAAYTYTENSDIDLHLVADMSKSKKSEIYRELFDAKKYQYNDLHDYRIGPHEVEVYVHDADQEHISQGIYSILNNDWVSVPTRRQIEIDDMSVSSKFEDVKNRIKTAIDSGDLEHMNRLAKKIGEMRKSGLSKTGEFGPENLAFKILRNTGWLEQLKLARNDAKDAKLSIQEEDNKKHVEEHINDFINFCINWLNLGNAPKIDTVHNLNWSIDNKTFGQYNSRDDLITVNIGGRHPVDAMRTIAHELVHYAQNRESPLPPEAGKTGSRWENDANSTAGQIMRDYVDVNPAAFANNLNEASGYIAKNSKEAKDPRYSHGLTVDIKPGEIQRQAAKLGLSTDSAGVPPLLGKKKNKKKSNLKENLRADVPNEDYNWEQDKGYDFKNPLPIIDNPDVWDDIDEIESVYYTELKRQLGNKYNTMTIRDRGRALRQLANVESVPISKIVSTEKWLDSDKINTIRAGNNSNPSSELPVLFQIGNKFIASDGNHRIVALTLNGEKTIQASVFTADTRIKNKRKSDLKENLKVDVPNDEWLNKKIRKAKEEGRDDFGVPYTGTITAYFPDTVKLPVDLLKKLPGMRREQKNVRREDLEKIMQVMKGTGKLPLTPSGKEYAPFVQVAWNGEAWVNEGNHRIMAADALGWKYLPVELRYYDGGERIESGVLYPQKLGLNENFTGKKNK